jgi:hypothetical protein
MTCNRNNVLQLADMEVEVAGITWKEVTDLKARVNSQTARRSMNISMNGREHEWKQPLSEALCQRFPGGIKQNHKYRVLQKELCPTA